jgi:hypothetical protein
MATSTPQLDTRWLNADEAPCEALFASDLQPSAAPTAGVSRSFRELSVQ